MIITFFVQENELLLRSYGDSFQPFFDVAQKGGLRIGQGNDENAISLTDAALRPRRQTAIALV